MNFGDVCFVYPGSYEVGWNSDNIEGYPIVLMDSGREFHLENVSIEKFEEIIKIGQSNPIFIFDLDTDVYDLEDLDLKTIKN